MPQSQGIKATVVRYNDNLPESDYHEYVSNTAKTFIKVRTGEKFYVKIKVTPEFDFKSSPEVRIFCSIDGEDNFYWALSPADLANPIENPIRFKEVDRFVPAANRFMSCAMSFGELKTDEDFELAPELFTRNVSMQGRTVVRTERGRSMNKRPEFSYSYSFDTDKAPKAVTKTNLVSHTLKSLPIANANPPVSTWSFQKALEHEPIRLYIRYRSQRSLELLNVIPDELPAVANSTELRDNGKRPIKRERPSIKQEPSEESRVLGAKAIRAQLDVTRGKKQRSIKSEPEEYVRVPLGRTLPDAVPTTESDEEVQFITARPAPRLRSKRKRSDTATEADGRKRIKREAPEDGIPLDGHAKCKQNDAASGRTQQRKVKLESTGDAPLPSIDRVDAEDIEVFEFRPAPASKRDR